MSRRREAQRLVSSVSKTKRSSVIDAIHFFRAGDRFEELKA